jgi:anaerobic magnesium-protoporphyrin IX monomethyl ester cyclase
MRVLLVVYDNGSYIGFFPQGLAYIASALRNAGHEVVIYSQDLHHYPDAHLTAYLDENDFDMVGVSVIAGYYQYRKLLSLSEAINRSKNRPFYVIGGHGPSPEPEYFLRKTQADAVVVGEGEITVVELADRLAKKTPLSDVLGIAFREGEKVTINPRRPLIQDIDTIAFPAYDLFPIEFYRLLRTNPMYTSNTEFEMPILTGRGCTFECNFCYRLDKGFRPRSNESIIEEILLLKEKYQISFFTFTDELLMSSEARTRSLCEDFIRHKLDIRWECNGRLNYAKPALVSLMKKAGCVFINYGIESVDDQALKNMNKALTYKQIVAGIEATLAVGISPGFNIIFGNIGETKEVLDKDVEFLLKYDDGAHLRTIRPVTPYPGSPLYYYAIEKGLLKDCEDFYENKHVNSDLLAVNFTDMTDDEFHGALLEANKRLIENYYRNKMKLTIQVAENLYLKKDAAFRGFRPA